MKEAGQVVAIHGVYWQGRKGKEGEEEERLLKNGRSNNRGRLRKERET